MQISVTDMHTAGEPVRIITNGYPHLRGETILQQRRDARENHDLLRRALMLEPRGHSGMYGVIPVRPSSSAAAVAALFTHNEGYSTMCGHATIALGRWAIEAGVVQPKEPLTTFALELPCGIVNVHVTVRDGKVLSTSFDSVEAYLTHPDFEVETRNGPIKIDVAYGGAFYALVPSSILGMDFFRTPIAALVQAAIEITDSARQRITFQGWDPDLSFLYGTILTDDASGAEDTYNLCVFGEGQIDRSPTGSGVTARMARDHARGSIQANVSRRFFGPTGIPFTAAIIDDTITPTLSRGVVVRVEGSAFISGTSVFTLDVNDPFAYGFSLPKLFSELANRPMLDGGKLRRGMSANEAGADAQSPARLGAEK